MAQQRIRIIEGLCKGCGYCIEYCPNKVFEKPDRQNKKRTTPPKIVHQEKCTMCELCTMLCPDFALTVGEKENA